MKTTVLNYHISPPDSERDRCDGLNLLVKHGVFLASKEKFATYSDWVVIERERCIIVPFLLKHILNGSGLRVPDERQRLVLCLQFGCY